VHGGGPVPQLPRFRTFHPTVVSDRIDQRFASTKPQLLLMQLRLEPSGNGGADDGPLVGYELFESLVMPFGLTISNYSSTTCSARIWMYLQRHTWTYSDTLDEHKEHVQQVLEALSKAGLHLHKPGEMQVPPTRG